MMTFKNNKTNEVLTAEVIERSNGEVIVVYEINNENKWLPLSDFEELVMANDDCTWEE